MKRFIFVALFVCLFVNFADASASAITITASQLAHEYEENEVAADLKYKDKNITVSGTISDIGKNVADQIYVILKIKLIPLPFLGKIYSAFSQIMRLEM